jgi:hypothetical protein
MFPILALFPAAARPIFTLEMRLELLAHLAQPLLADNVVPIKNSSSITVLKRNILMKKELFWWDHASLRQAHNRDALRHTWRAWRKPQGMPTDIRR